MFFNGEESRLRSLLEKLDSGVKLYREEFACLMSAEPSVLNAVASDMAGDIARRTFGRRVFLRGLIEISSFCKNDCLYCGLRASNKDAQRYRLSREEILERCEAGYELGLRTFVLQGGEDLALTDEWVADVVREIKKRFAGVAVTLSLGERDKVSYRRFKDAGADRYLLRHETYNADHYARLHPQTMSRDARVACLHTLKRLGFQTGAGMMIGSPGQTPATLADDLMFLQELRPEMVGIGPFIPAHGTPFEHEPKGSVERTLSLISVVRIMFPRANIPATTALVTLDAKGREKGIMAGANVLMPNISPKEQRAKYSIYDNKANTGLESIEGLEELKERLAAIGYTVDWGRGDCLDPR